MTTDEAKIDELIQHYIELNPHRPGADDARLIDSGVAVWAIIGYWLAAGRDRYRVAEDYAIPVAAVDAAIAYYRRHQAIIEARIAANAADAA